MKRKITILILALLFFTANTALPFTLHICKMMDQTESCEHMIPKEEACCEEQPEADVYIASAFDQCCTAELIDLSLKGNFVGSKNELVPRFEFTISDFQHEDSPLKLISGKIRINISPPLIVSSNIYLFNSAFLI